MKVIKKENVYTINELIYNLKDKTIHQHDIEIIESMINKHQKHDLGDQPHFRNFKHFLNICEKCTISIDKYFKNFKH